jgi:hypothetical protein
MTPLELSEIDAQYGVSLTYDSRVVLYNCNMFIIDAIGCNNIRHF